MSTRTELTEAERDEAFRQIDAISNDVPISKTLTELQLVVERLTFSRLHEREQQNDPAAHAEIDLFFRDEVSDGMVRFIRWMADRNLLAALSGEHGRVFLDNCVSVYRKVQEVQFVTAVPLDVDHKATIVQRLRSVHPQPARIIFTTAPAIGAGFVINAGHTTVDKSLRSHVANTVPRSAAARQILPPESGVG